MTFLLGFGMVLARSLIRTPQKRAKVQGSSLRVLMASGHGVLGFKPSGFGLKSSVW